MIKALMYVPMDGNEITSEDTYDCVCEMCEEGN